MVVYDRHSSSVLGLPYDDINSVSSTLIEVGMGSFRLAAVASPFSVSVLLTADYR